MDQLKLVGGGLLGGLIGAGIWVAIAHTTGYEIGWIAWGVGGLVGLGVRLLGSAEMASFDRATRQRVVKRVPAMAPVAAGLVAAVIAVGAVVAAKYQVLNLALSQVVEVPDASNTEAILSRIADDIVLEREEAGREVVFPPGKDFDSAALEGDYPPDIWQEAEARWASLAPDERAAWLAQQGEEARAFYDAMGGGGAFALLVASFGLFDLLWFGLAGWTAFKLGMSIEE